jgi:hypothetical protein
MTHVISNSQIAKLLIVATAGNSQTNDRRQQNRTDKPPSKQKTPALQLCQRHLLNLPFAFSTFAE